MKFKTLLFAITPLLFIVTSCVPIAIAPELSQGKFIKGKKFKRKLPNRNAFVFTDPKAADEFYYYINTKFGLNYNYVESNVPVEIANDTYYISFYETKKSTKSINLMQPMANNLLENNGLPRVFNEDGSVRSEGTWYIVLMITDQEFNDALNPEYENYDHISKYAKSLLLEYLSMSNYNQAILNNSGI